jgi:hypothetical protein
MSDDGGYGEHSVVAQRTNNLSGFAACSEPVNGLYLFIVDIHKRIFYEHFSISACCWWYAW